LPPQTSEFGFRLKEDKNSLGYFCLLVAGEILLSSSRKFFERLRNKETA
jgi:hypothetical protein